MPVHSPRTTRVHACAAALTLALFPAAALAGVAAASFTPIPGRPGDNPAASNATGISGNGAVVYGEVRTIGIWEAMRWTPATGTTAHGQGYFTGASFDGSVLSGSRGRWAAGNWQTLTSPAGTSEPIANGISDDGLTLVGSARLGGNRAAAVWRNGGTTGTLLPALLGGGLSTVEAGRATTDGSFIAGTWVSGGSSAWATDGITSWTLDARTSGLADLSSDGRWAVGPRGLATSAGYRLDLTTSAFIEIPNMPGRQGGTARGVSADGSVIVGYGGTSRRAYIWTPTGGTRELSSVLSGLGVNLGNWVLLEARGISDDGLTIVGLGVNPQGLEQSWVAVIPAPGTAFVLLTGGLFAASRRRRHEACR